MKNYNLFLDKIKGLTKRLFLLTMAVAQWATMLTLLVITLCILMGISCGAIFGFVKLVEWLRYLAG